MNGMLTNITTDWMNSLVRFYQDATCDPVGMADNIFQYLLVNLPQFEEKAIQWTFYFADIFFNPKQILRQVGLVFALQTTLLLGNSVATAVKYVLQRTTAKGRQLREIQRKMQNVSSYEEWQALAEEEDKINGYDVWRAKDESSLYDSSVLRQRITDLSGMIKKNRVFDLMFRLRGGLARDQHGMQHEGLFTRAKAGTKHIVECYHDTAMAALNLICDGVDVTESIPNDAKLAFFNETRHAYGRTALLLSGGASLGFYHIGLAKALWSQGMLPRVISGASAGSLIASVLGVRNDDEIMEMLENVSMRTDPFKMQEIQNNAVDRSFWARSVQFYLPQTLRWFGELILGGFYKQSDFMKSGTDHLKQMAIDNCGYYTFQEAFDRTGRIINIIVAPLNKYDPPRLLNYLTAPHVCVWSAACASCAIPGVFDSIQLFVKEPNGEYRPENAWTLQGKAGGAKEEHNHPTNVQSTSDNSRYTDGSVDADLPMQQISELFNVNHFIVSQVNPHSSILSSLAVRATHWSPALFGLTVGYLRFLKTQLKDWVKNIMDLVVYRSLTPSWGAKRGLVGIITQEYEGRAIDVTIQPWNGYLNPITALFHLIKNINKDEFKAIIRVGENNTYPYLSRIKAQCAVERTLDKCVNRLRARLFKESQQHDHSHASLASSDITFEDDGAYINNGVGANGDGDGDGLVFVKKSIKTRIPSFCASRSVTNLSEYSVPDPFFANSNNDTASQQDLVSPQPRTERLISDGRMTAGEYDSIFTVPLNDTSNNYSHKPTSSSSNDGSGVRRSQSRSESMESVESVCTTASSATATGVHSSKSNFSYGFGNSRDDLSEPVSIDDDDHDAESRYRGTISGFPRVSSRTGFHTNPIGVEPDARESGGGGLKRYVILFPFFVYIV